MPTLYADTVIRDANVITIDASRPRAQAVAIRDGKFKDEIVPLEVTTTVVSGGPDGNGARPVYCVADPFDGSYLFKRDIPDFWFSSPT